MKNMNAWTSLAMFQLIRQDCASTNVCQGGAASQVQALQDAVLLILDTIPGPD
jgi:hypothetical protein